MAAHQQEQNSLLLEWQTGKLRQILESSGSEHGDAQRILAFGQSLRNRRQLRTPTYTPRTEIAKLKTWTSSAQSSLLVAQPRGIKNSSMDFAVGFLEIVIETRVSVVWALPSGSDRSPTVIGLLQSLVMQTLQLLGRVTNYTPAGILSVSMQDLNCASSTSDWFDILERCLHHIEKIFVVIDEGLVQRACNNEDGFDGMGVDQFMNRLSATIRSKRQGWLKVMLVSCLSDAFDQAESECFIEVLRVVTDRGVAQERKFWNPKLKAMAKRQGRITMYHFREAVRSLDHGSLQSDVPT